MRLICAQRGVPLQSVHGDAPRFDVFMKLHLRLGCAVYLVTVLLTQSGPLHDLCLGSLSYARLRVPFLAALATSSRTAFPNTLCDLPLGSALAGGEAMCVSQHHVFDDQCSVEFTPCMPLSPSTSPVSSVTLHTSCIPYKLSALSYDVDHCLYKRSLRVTSVARLAVLRAAHVANAVVSQLSKGCNSAFCSLICLLCNSRNN
jgi:hypothetical protein